jgi:hypothetical protein
LIFLLFLALSMRQLLDYDVWFQLLAGEDTFRRMAVPKAEFYIYSVLGEPSIFVGWLWGLMLYLAWLAGGYGLVSLFGAAVWGLVFAGGVAASLAGIAREIASGTEVSRKAQMAAALIGATVAYQYLVGRAVFRAEVTLYLAWVVAIYLAVGISDERRRLYRFLIGVPLLSWALGWLHTTSIFMVLVLAGFLCQTLSDTVQKGGAPAVQAFIKMDLWRWLLSISAALVLPCLNPNGVQQALPLIASLGDAMGEIVTHAPGKETRSLIHINFEYRRLLDVPQVWPAAVLFLFSSVVVLWGDKRHRVANALFLIVGLFLSLLHIRALALWAVFLMVPLGVAVAPWLQKAVIVLKAKGRAFWVDALIAMCCVWTIGIVFNREATRWGLGVGPQAAEEQLLNALRTHLPEGGRVFNWHPLGAYLRWHLGPHYFVAMDGHFTDAHSGAWKAYFDIEDDKENGPRLLTEWKIDAVYHPAVVPSYGDVHWLPYELMKDRQWRLVAIDRHGLAFVRSGKHIDERTHTALQIEYWRRVVAEATGIALGSGIHANRQRATTTLQYAGEQIRDLQALLSR